MRGLAFTLHLVLCAVASCISLVPNQGAGDQFQAVGHLFQGHTEGIRGFIYVIFQSWNQLEFFQVPCEYSNTAADKAFSSGLKSIRTFYVFISVFLSNHIWASCVARVEEICPQAFRVSTVGTGSLTWMTTFRMNVRSQLWPSCASWVWISGCNFCIKIILINGFYKGLGEKCMLHHWHILYICVIYVRII